MCEVLLKGKFTALSSYYEISESKSVKHSTEEVRKKL